SGAVTRAGRSDSITPGEETATARVAALDLSVEWDRGLVPPPSLVTNGRAVPEPARQAVPEHWQQMGEQRVSFSSAVLCGPRGGIVLASDFDEAIAFVNDYAPEHLEILAKDPFTHLGRIQNAGEILLGQHTPLPLATFVPA